MNYFRTTRATSFACRFNWLIDLKKQAKFESKGRSHYPMQRIDQWLSAASRHNAVLLLFVVCCGVTVIGALVIRDMQQANTEAQKMYKSSVNGLQEIGELQYDAQETRRTTLYALTTTDSNLQVEYADQTRDADRRVRNGIAEYGRQAKGPEELALAERLNRDWTAYLGVRDEVLASILEGSTSEAVNLDLKGGVPAFERVRQDLNEVKRLYGEDASREQASLAESSRRSSSRMVGILSFTFLLSTAAVWAIQRSQMLGRMQLANLQMEFVASVSHELRTPLAVIRSAADNIADGLVKNMDALLRYGAILQHQSRSMGELVDQILLFASTEDRKKRVPLQPLPVERIIETVLSDTEALVRDSGFTLDIEVEPGLPHVLGDLAGITQCLRNLVGNAVKYGGADRRILLRAGAFLPRDKFPGEVRISITDRGIGIDSSEIAHIFDPFYRSPRVHASQIHGTGLGLALAKRIAESMGGSLTVFSQLSAGSTFTLHLQIAQGDDLTMPASDGRQSRMSLT
jgi:signal transduction histidine kinase